ncbi:hypothetical protein ECTOBSL9_1560 [Ectothiorhodospira sp. BSL-9]|nr:hypothetical protein ECTOBSL9_1560 [Ectothiorhodospira sp. BSL-9]
MVSQLQPGDHLQLAPGEYTQSLNLRELRGTADAPIVISGPSEGEPAIFLARSGRNTIQLRNSAHLVIQHLTLDGRGQNAAAIVAESEGEHTHSITIQYLRISNYDRSQGHIGISTRVPAWNWVIRNNEIRNVGTGMYLGRPDGSAPFVAGLIENNLFEKTTGYNAQIKHQNVRDLVPGMPSHPQQTIIRYNVFSKAQSSSTGNSARPNLLLGHWPPEGVGMHDRYLVYGNIFYQNPSERLFQGEGNLAIYNNLFVNHHGDGLIVRPHNHTPRQVHILKNTFVANGFGINIVQPDTDYEQVVAGNAVFSDNPLVLPGHVDSRQNFTADRADARALLISPESGLEGLDLYPRNRSLQSPNPIEHTLVAPGLNVDFNNRTRHHNTWGAYDDNAKENPGRSGRIGPNVENCKPCQRYH